MKTPAQAGVLLYPGAGFGMTGGGPVSEAAPTRSIARRVLLHPLLWAVVCFAAALPLLGTEHDFWGFLLALLSGWLGAHAAVRVLVPLRPAWLSVTLHVVLGAVVAVLLFGLVSAAEWRDALPAALLPGLLVLQFAAAPAAGWVWLTLIGRVTGAVRDGASRREAALTEPAWARDADGWGLELRAVPLRRGTFLALGVGLGALAAVLVGGFLLVFDDLAQRMSPLVMLLVLGWTVGLPAYLVLRAVARSRTVAISLRVDGERMRVLRSDEGAPISDPPLFDAPVAELRRLRWSARSAPTRIELLRDGGSSIVLLIGMAKRPKGESPMLPPLPRQLLRALESAGLPEKASKRPRDEELVLERRR